MLATEGVVEKPAGVQGIEDRSAISLENIVDGLTFVIPMVRFKREVVNITCLPFHPIVNLMQNHAVHFLDILS
jgi:hypothetical protein